MTTDDGKVLPLEAALEGLSLELVLPGATLDANIQLDSSERLIAFYFWAANLTSRICA